MTRHKPRLRIRYCLIRRTLNRSDVAVIEPCCYNGAEQWRIVKYVTQMIPHAAAQDLTRRLNERR